MGGRSYLRRIAFFPPLAAVATIAEVVLSPKFVWHFDAEFKRIHDEGVARGAPPVDSMPSRAHVVWMAACLGAARGFGFALIRPILPKQPEAAALMYSALGASALVGGLTNVERIFIHKRPDQPPRASLLDLIRAWAPRVAYRAAITAAIDRKVTISLSN